jgi:VIT1/CCC1 family predicted Fe2+/Mn2+ transporter/rubrerythrin
MDQKAPKPSKDLVHDLQENYKRERAGVALYSHLAGLEKSPAKKAILLKLAQAEGKHAERWAALLRELGESVPDSKLSWQARLRMRLVRWLGMETAIRQQEADEDRDIGIYERQHRHPSPKVQDILKEVEAEEHQHRRFLRVLEREEGPQSALDAILKRERWHHFGRGWVSDAIYGANDGLGAVFGLVAGVAGYTHVSHWILVSGLAGTVASALSMAAGAFLAAKSSRELTEAELAREQKEVEENPEEEREELELIYQLKGFTPEESSLLVQKLSQRPDQFMKTMAAEELGISEMNVPSPARAAVSSGVSTAVGAIVPVLPFFWLDGLTAIIVAASVSMAAHFLVGVAKSLITVRSWWSSGLEMTGVGALEGVVTYGLGLAAGKLL